MQTSSDGQRLERLEKKIDDGFAEVRTALRSEIRTLLSVIFGLWGATALTVVGVLLNHG